MNVDSLLSRDIQYFYPDDEDGNPVCQAHALGMIFDSVLIFDQGPYMIEYWSTEDIAEVSFDVPRSRN